MKHYICLEDHQITYACGTVKAKGFQIISADIMSIPKENKEQAVREFAVKNNLAGKRVVLGLDSGIFFSVLNMPTGKPRELKEMVCNELKYSIGKEQELVVSSVPFRINTDGTNTTVLTFAMTEKDLNRQLDLLKQAGIRCQKAYVLSNCMGHMAARLFPDKKMMILVEAAKEQIRILLIEDGYCTLARTIRLNIKHFCQTGAFGLLYDEITEQVSTAIQFHKSNNKEDAIEAIIFSSDILPNKHVAAKEIGANLGIPCTVANVQVEVRDGINPDFVKSCHRALAVMTKHQGKQSGEVNLLSAARHERSEEKQNGRRNFWYRAGMGLLASTFLLAGSWLFLCLQNHMYYRNIQELIMYIEDSERQQEYHLAIEMKDKVGQIQRHKALAETEASFLQSVNVFKYADYQAIQALMPGYMSIAGMRYDSDKGIYELDIHADNPAEFPDLIEQIRKSEQFSAVTYNYWKRIEVSEDEYYYSMTVLAKLGEGEQYEAK